MGDLYWRAFRGALEGRNRVLLGAVLISASHLTRKMVLRLEDQSGERALFISYPSR